VIGTVTRYQQIVKSLDRSTALVAQRPEVRREADYYLASIRKVTSHDDFIRDDRLFRFAMTAFGLEDMAYAKAFMRKVLAEGIDGRDAFAMQLADTRFREFAEAFNFRRYGAAATAFDRAQQGTVDRYVRIQLEKDAGRADEGVRLALYFQRKAPDVTSIYGLMADAALYKVVQSALGLPAAYSGVDIDRQAAFISTKLDIAELRDPEKLDRFLERFTARWQAANGTAGQSAPLVGLGQPLLVSFDNNLLLSLQSFKPGGVR
jgi:hypothetical protein